MCISYGILKSFRLRLQLTICFGISRDGLEKKHPIAENSNLTDAARRDSGRIQPSTGPRFPYSTTVTWAYSRLSWPHWTSWPLSQATKAEARTSACTNHSQREEPLSNACLTQSPKGKVDRQDGWTQYDGCPQHDDKLSTWTDFKAKDFSALKVFSSFIGKFCCIILARIGNVLLHL